METVGWEPRPDGEIVMPCRSDDAVDIVRRDMSMLVSVEIGGESPKTFFEPLDLRNDLSV